MPKWRGKDYRTWESVSLYVGFLMFSLAQFKEDQLVEKMMLWQIHQTVLSLSTGRGLSDLGQVNDLASLLFPSCAVGEVPSHRIIVRPCYG